MKRAALLVFFVLSAVPRVLAQERLLEWTRVSVNTKLDNDGRVDVAETHEIRIRGEVSTISRDLNMGADQRAEIRGVFLVEPDGSRRPLSDAPVAGADSYQAYNWGLLFSLKAETAPPFADVTARKYVIEYTLHGGLSPAWDLAAGPLALDPGTAPRSPLDRAKEVFAAWKQAWPEIDRHYRFDHDVEFPTRDSGNSLPELNYRFEYDTAWVLLDKDRDIGVATPDIDYRVQRVLRYLPAGRPKEVNLDGAAFRVAGAFGPLVIGLGLGFLFLASGRLLRRGPRGDRVLFEARVDNLPKELLATQLGQSANPPSFEDFLLRMAAQKRVSITVETPATEEVSAEVSLRLTVERSKLHPIERSVVDALFGQATTVSTRDIQNRFRGRDFDPDELLVQAFDTIPKRRVSDTRRIAWTVFQFGLTAAGFVLIVRSLMARTLEDPLPILAGLVPGHIIASVWPIGASARRASFVTVALALTALGLLGAAVALSPNTPLDATAALGLGLMSLGHCAGYLARLPKPTAADLELEAARDWAIGELRRPRPALRDAWVESLETMGAGRALANWRKRSADFTAPPDMADLGLADMQAGPPFTGEAPRAPNLPAGWVFGFTVFAEDEDEEDDEGR